MTQSGLGGQFWFSAAIIAKGARHVTNKERLCICNCTRKKKRISLSSGPFDAVLMYIRMKNGEDKARTFL